MECNKDEAGRSKGIAEAKFLQHEFAGAKKFALKARQLFPELEGLPQFISALEVHIAADERLAGGERNWYGILQIDPTADESTIRKQYRRLALLLHPDKNKSVGAEAAFKHISEAWGTLSDKMKKAAYDARLNSKAPQSWKVAQYKEPTSTSNGFHNINRPSTASQPQPQHQPQPQPAPPRPPPPPPPDLRTFWTACPSCKMQFEYQLLYKNSTLCCPICHKPFFAREVSAVSGTTLWPPHAHQGFRTDAANGSSHGMKSSSSANGNFPWTPFRNAAAPQVVHSQVRGRQSKENAEVRQRKDVGRKEQRQKGDRKREKDQIKAKAAAQAKEAFDRLIARSKVVIEQKLSSDKAAASERKVGEDNPTTFGHVWCDISSVPEERTASNQKATTGKATATKVEGKENMFGYEHENVHQAVHISPGGKRNTPAGLKVQDDTVPAKKQRADGPVTLDEHASEDAMYKRCGDLNVSETERGKMEGIGGHEMSRETEVLKASKDVGETGKMNVSMGHSLQEKHSLPVAAPAISVPDSEFYEFDKDRNEHHFSVGQIWAAYDDDDGMPRYYARISKVISFQPFKLQMSWLEARSPSDETLAWLDAGFSYTCGEFKLGETTTSEFINTFSHLMMFEKGQRGGFKIYPRKGDVWALYKHWKTLKTKDAELGYDMTEVLTDFNEEEGVQISLLVKVEGFKTLFRRQHGAQYVQWISPTELRTFSHQVPAHRLAVEEALGIQEGCWELDPASTPFTLITGKQGE